MKKFYSILQGIFAIAVIISFTACSSEKNSESTDDLEVQVAEVDVWVIDEYQINDIPVTTKPPKSAPAGTAEKDDAAEISKEAEAAANAMATQMDAEYEAESEEYDVLTLDAVNTDLVQQEYEATEIVDVNEAIIPLDETQTVVAYNKKGEANAAFQVVTSGPDNEIDQIVFTDKKHTDVYDVSAGMTGKEVKQVRREMKHMVKNGQVFLYNDESNIMYLMDASDKAGDEITAEDVESMEVQAVIWKDKKHHKKDN